MCCVTVSMVTANMFADYNANMWCFHSLLNFNYNLQNVYMPRVHTNGTHTQTHTLTHQRESKRKSEMVQTMSRKKNTHIHAFTNNTPSRAQHKRIHGMIEAYESETIIESIYTYVGWEWDTHSELKRKSHMYTYNNEHFRVLNFSYCSFQNSNCAPAFTLYFVRIAYSFVLAIQNGTK